MYLSVVVLSVLLGCANCLQLENFYNYLRDNDNGSSVDCEVQKAAFLEGLNNGDSWAAKMLDAYGRPPAGRTQGNANSPGMYDQCLTIYKQLITTTIRGKYCYSGLVVPLTSLSPSTSQLDESIKRRIARSGFPINTEDDDEVSTPSFLLLAACVPNACNPSDLFGILGIDSFCQTDEENKKLDAGDIACICFFAVIGCFIVASTIYDVYLQKSSKVTKHPLLLAFSVYTNGKKILKTTQQQDQILCFNGIKVVSMFWVILGHRYSSLEFLVANQSEVAAWRSYWYAAYALLAPLAVDTFLFISGALLAYVFLKTMRKPNQKFNIGMYYLHRYLRLTPALAVLYFFMVTLARRVSDGPMHPMLTGGFRTPCLDNWWSFFLYIQNYVATDNMCMGHSWYLSIDMQLYVVSPLLLLPMVYFGKRITYLVLPILVLAGITGTMLLFYFNDLVLWSDDYYNLFYYITHMRFSPWLIGVIFGAFLVDYQANKSRYQIKNKLILLALWTSVVCVMGFIFFYQNDADYNHTRIKSTFFFPLQRPLWALCLCWICYACISGNGGFLNSFLSAPFFQVLSKITYSTYLVHQPIIIMLSLGHMRAPPFFTDIDGIRTVLADICMSCIVGGLWTLAFESPILVLEKVIFGRSSGKRKIEEAKDSNSNPEPRA